MSWFRRIPHRKEECKKQPHHADFSSDELQKEIEENRRQLSKHRQTSKRKLEMENFIDDNEAYQRLKPTCVCGCLKHCGLSCMTDGCDCFECACPMCQDPLLLVGIDVGRKSQ